jgi:hypothetical protein
VLLIFLKIVLRLSNFSLSSFWVTFALPLDAAEVFADIFFEIDDFVILKIKSN